MRGWKGVGREREGRREGRLMEMQGKPREERRGGKERWSKGKTMREARTRKTERDVQQKIVHLSHHKNDEVLMGRLILVN